MKVYILTSGEYSDYHIVYVTLDKNKAEEVANITNSHLAPDDNYSKLNIEEFDTDSLDLFIPSDKIFYVSRNERGEIYVDFCEYKTAENYVIEFNRVYTIGWRPGIYTYVKTKDADKAYKIATDLFAEYDAEKAGIKL